MGHINSLFDFYLSGGKVNNVISKLTKLVSNAHLGTVELLKPSTTLSFMTTKYGLITPVLHNYWFVHFLFIHVILFILLCICI